MVKVFETGATAMFSFAIQTDITLTFLPNAVLIGNIVYIASYYLNVKFSNQTHVPFKVQLS
jgi:hypothetical protein